MWLESICVVVVVLVEYEQWSQYPTVVVPVRRSIVKKIKERRIMGQSLNLNYDESNRIVE